jgi:ribonuclease HII
MIGHHVTRPRLAGALTAGVDEAGRGPLAGPVFAAAVILDARRPVRGLRDSKELAPEDRERLAAGIRGRAVAWAIGWADAAEIDGNRCPGRTLLGLDCELVAIVGGDARVREISAASILAKTARDAFMTRMAGLYPDYGFERHKGYPTEEHFATLARVGPCRLHRQSFAPLRR